MTEDDSQELEESPSQMDLVECEMNITRMRKEGKGEDSSGTRDVLIFGGETCKFKISFEELSFPFCAQVWEYFHTGRSGCI